MIRYDPQRHHRRSIRLKGYDYTQPGAYFITLCTYEHAHLFGRVVDGVMVLDALGEITRQCWLAIPDHFPHTRLDEFVIMPNHVHGIVWITHSVGATHASPLQNAPPLQASSKSSPQPRGPARGSIGAIVGSFKSAVTHRINQHRATPGTPVWQRDYFDHIIRTEHTLNAIRQYIHNNPLRWHLDRYNPDATGPDPLARDIWRMLTDHEGDIRRGDACVAPTTTHIPSNKPKDYAP